jgi:hypothetical protein
MAWSLKCRASPALDGNFERSSIFSPGYEQCTGFGYRRSLCWSERDAMDRSGYVVRWIDLEIRLRYARLHLTSLNKATVGRGKC